MHRPVEDPCWYGAILLRNGERYFLHGWIPVGTGRGYCLPQPDFTEWVDPRWYGASLIAFD